MKTFKIKMIASNRIVFDGEATSVTFPSIDGQIQIMADYEPFIIPITTGELKLVKADGEVMYSVVGRGFVKVTAHGSTQLIVDTLEKPEEIDIRRAQEAKERAEEQLRQKLSQQQYFIHKAAMARAMSRLKEAQRTKGRI